MSTDPSHRPPGPGTATKGAQAPDRSTELAEQRTALSVERSFLAFERTRGAVVGRFGRTWASDTVGLAMIAIGTAALAIAVVQHKRRVDALRSMGLLPQWNLALGVAAMVAVLGVFAFASLVFPG